MASSLQGFVSAEEHHNLLRKYNNLHHLYATLAAEHEKCTALVKKAEARYAAAKKSAMEWSTYLESKGFLSKKDVDRVEPPASETRQSPTKQDVSRITSSQTTEGDPNDAQPLDLGPARDEEESDEPEVVSVRTVKRRRRVSMQDMPPPVRIKVEAASPGDPIILASEENSSPVPQRQVRPVEREASDLDAYCEPLQTPRKRQRVRAVSEEFIRPSTLVATISSRSDGDLQGMIEDEDAAAAHVKAERYESHDPFATTANLDYLPRHSQRSSKDKALRQRSANILNTPLGASRSGVRGKRKRSALPNSAGILSEDGDQESSQLLANIGADPVSTDHRLDGLLAGAVEERLPLPKRPPPERNPLPRPKAIASPTVQPPLQSITTKKASPHRIPTPPQPTPRRPLNPSAGPRPSKPEPPLRQRPPSTLDLSDFRVNPSYQDSTYAFAQVVRGRDSRRCLPGCTRPDCCGAAFKKAIEFDRTGAISNGLQQTTDAQALEAYLGPDFAIIMGAYDPEKRKDVLLEAHAFVFSNRHGKHRRVFERHSTPPGFWRTDMPTTQEEKEDREAALVMERAKVEERWREAMRGGAGARWIFRDEQ